MATTLSLQKHILAKDVRQYFANHRMGADLLQTKCVAYSVRELSEKWLRQLTSAPEADAPSRSFARFRNTGTLRALNCVSCPHYLIMTEKTGTSASICAIASTSGTTSASSRIYLVRASSTSSRGMVSCPFRAARYKVLPGSCSPALLVSSALRNPTTSLTMAFSST